MNRIKPMILIDATRRHVKLDPIIPKVSGERNVDYQDRLYVAALTETSIYPRSSYESICEYANRLASEIVASNNHGLDDDDAQEFFDSLNAAKECKEYHRELKAERIRQKRVDNHKNVMMMLYHNTLAVIDGRSLPFPEAVDYNIRGFADEMTKAALRSYSNINMVSDADMRHLDKSTIKKIAREYVEKFLDNAENKSYDWLFPK